MIEVHELRATDIPEADRIAALSFTAETERPLFLDELGRSVARCWVAREGSELVGYVLVWLVIDQAEVISIAVDPLRRGRGVGRLLLDHFLAQVTADGVTAASLEVRASNGPAIALYEARGFTRVGERLHYYGNGEDALTYALPLRRGQG